MRSLFCLLVAASVAGAQDVPPLVRDWVSRNEARVVRDAVSLFALPNLASDSVNIRLNAARLLELLEARGVSARLLESPSGGPPAVFGELRVPGAARTVVLYAHYDGQPVSTGEWLGDPWTPVLRQFSGGRPGAVVPLPAPGERVDPELRIFARSSSDDKGPIVAMLAALDALKEAGIAPSVNLKFFFEGEEEAGSPNVGLLLAAHPAVLSADAWIFGDGPVHVSGMPQIVLGVRGVAGVEVTLYGPNRALHSGHYGNWAPNPALALAQLLTTLRDRDGRILIAGFADDVVPATVAERAAAERLSTTDDSVRRSLGLGATEAGGAASALRILSPALNVRGVRSGGTGSAAANAIPTSATASIDFRLVPRQTPERIRALFERHLTDLGYEVVHDSTAAAAHPARERLAFVQWQGGYRATRTPIDDPFVRALAQVTERALGHPPFVAPTLGGSLPMHLFEEQFAVPLIVLPMVNADNNQHAANENLRVQNLFDGVVLYATLMAELGARLVIR